ncbi:saccharopine dehydrogenase NADP-binding domain-containing protein [Nocardia paucivorans]|uniref:saccharopine dehydrogenase NADP-binding domain-containing protein n=1 Tax=Nocardia paucivorans TaxID=114259 RepID=UPI00030DD540|nr:saccharopine dehydrogenase NADP-binding domain-containing protein [Nocardia paucivorans]
MTRILLLGATGAVGRACLSALSADPRSEIIVAGRAPGRVAELCAGPATRPAPEPIDLAALTDGHDRRLAELVRTVDVVVNCAGPSHRYGIAVAEIALRGHSAYVDPGLDESQLHRLQRIAPADGVALVQAGIQPGLSGVALRLAADRLGGRADALTAWCGGLQPLTRAAVHEYLAGLTAGNGGVSTVRRAGMRVRVRPHEVAPAPAPWFPHTAQPHVHLDTETEIVSEAVRARDVEWVNVTDGEHTVRAIRDLRSAGSAAPPSDTAVDTVLAAAELDLFGREPYFTLLATARSAERAATFLLRTRDSYAVTGAVTAWAARTVTALPAGVHPLRSIPNPQALMAELSGLVPGTEARVIDGAADMTTDHRDLVEEGVL